MADLSHVMGNDLILTASGDLATVAGADATRQRVLRRLLTNPGDYIWQLTYGGGLARFVSQAAPSLRIAATIRRQMRLERGVGTLPAPTVAVSADALGTLTARVAYADQDGTPASLSVPVVT